MTVSMDEMLAGPEKQNSAALGRVPGRRGVGNAEEGPDGMVGGPHGDALFVFALPE
jgi:hypothetical protein